MPTQLLAVDKNLKINLTKELVLSACWNIEAIKTEKYVKDYPSNPKTFQWPSGWSEWITQILVGGKQYGLFLKSSSKDTIDLCLIDVPQACPIWQIGYDTHWVWRRNPNLLVDLDHWWNKAQSKIRLLEDVLNGGENTKDSQ